MLSLKEKVLDYTLHFKGFVKPSLCDLIDNQIFQKQFDDFEEGRVGSSIEARGIKDKEIRSVLVRGLEEEQIGLSVANRIIFNELKMIVSSIEEKYFKHTGGYYFSSQNYFQFLYYNAGMKGHYDFHTDHSLKSPRVLTILIGINQAKEYSGGKLYVQNDKEGVKLDMGDVVCFPSNFMYPHKVEPVTKGERKVLVAWTQ